MRIIAAPSVVSEWIPAGPLDLSVPELEHLGDEQLDEFVAALTDDQRDRLADAVAYDGSEVEEPPPAPAGPDLRVDLGASDALAALDRNGRPPAVVPSDAANSFDDMGMKVTTVHGLADEREAAERVARQLEGVIGADRSSSPSAAETIVEMANQAVQRDDDDAVALAALGDTAAHLQRASLLGRMRDDFDRGDHHAGAQPRAAKPPQHHVTTAEDQVADVNRREMERFANHVTVDAAGTAHPVTGRRARWPE